MTTSTDWTPNLGPVRRWRDGDIYLAENDFISGAWVVTDDPAKVGELGWHKNAKGEEICVEFCDAKTVIAWYADGETSNRGDS